MVGQAPTTDPLPARHCVCGRGRALRHSVGRGRAAAGSRVTTNAVRRPAGARRGRGPSRPSGSPSRRRPTTATDRDEWESSTAAGGGWRRKGAARSRSARPSSAVGAADSRGVAPVARPQPVACPPTHRAFCKHPVIPPMTSGWRPVGCRTACPASPPPRQLAAPVVSVTPPPRTSCCLPLHTPACPNSLLSCGGFPRVGAPVGRTFTA